MSAVSVSLSPLLPLLIIALSFAVVAALTEPVRRALIRRAVLDRPNARSSHAVPVPRGGGWALLAAVGPGLMAAAALTGRLQSCAGLVAGLFLLVAVSWADDRKGLSPALRLAAHLAAAALGLSALPGQALLFAGALPPWLDHGLIVLGWAWFMNAYNFMDGIDGITGVETIIIATGSCLVAGAAGLTDPVAQALALLLIGACLGFLVHNWHSARIFLGDVGSVPLGFLAGFLLLGLAVRGYPAAAVILPLYYLADSGITITRRALRGEKIWRPHREHFYQKAAARCGRHDRVALAIGLTGAGLIVAAMISVPWPLAGIMAGGGIVSILIWKMGNLSQNYKNCLK